MENPLLEESVTVPDPVEKPKNTVAEAQTDEGKNEPGAQTVQETPTVPQLPHPLTVIVNTGSGTVTLSSSNGFSISQLTVKCSYTLVSGCAAVSLTLIPEMGDALAVYVNGRQISLPRTADVNGRRENEFYHICHHPFRGWRYHNVIPIMYLRIHIRFFVIDADDCCLSLFPPVDRRSCRRLCSNWKMPEKMP